jgi:hypothetical protein
MSGKCPTIVHMSDVVGKHLRHRSSMKITVAAVCRSHTALALVTAALVAVGCRVDVDDDGEHEYGEWTWGAGLTEQAQRVTGGWAPSADTLAVGDTWTVEYDSAPSWDGGANCSGGSTAGARVLRDVIVAAFPQTSGVGVYNCRVIAGTNSMSLHGVGRALDIMIPTISGDADNGSGDPIAAWLMEHAGEFGLQGIIWDKKIWTTSRRAGERLRSLDPSVNQHVDHIHAEINEAAGALGYDWYDNPTGPGVAEECPALPADGGVVDEGPCVQLFGPAQYWRTEGAGVGGSLRWTNAFQNDTPSNHSRTVARLAVAGTWDVDASLDAAFARFARTRYRITDADGEHVVFVDQAAAAAAGRWARLGTFRTADGGGDIVVVVEDNADGAVPTEARSIVVDAVRVTPTTTTATPSTPPTEDPAADPGSPADETGTDPGSSPDAPEGTTGAPVPGADEDEIGPVVDADLPEADDPIYVSAGVVADGGCAATPASSATGAALVALLAVLRGRRSFARRPLR